MVVLVVGSESSQNWVRVVSGLGPNRLGSEKYQGSELSWVRVVRLPRANPEKKHLAQPQAELGLSKYQFIMYDHIIFDAVACNRVRSPFKKVHLHRPFT